MNAAFSLRLRFFSKALAVFVAFLAAGLPLPTHAQPGDASRLLAILQPGQRKLAWEIHPDLLKAIGHLEGAEPLDAKILSNALLATVHHKKPGGNKTECCYEKVADGVWSCCDGTFVRAIAQSLTTLFDLAGKGPKVVEDPSRLSERFRPLLARFNQADAFVALQPDDPRMNLIPWENMKK